MATILSWSNQQIIKAWSSNNSDKYTQIATEVENHELVKLLGRAFVYDIQENPGNYNDLLTGVEFEDCYGNTVKHQGINFVLAYLNYSKYLGESFVADTYSGFVAKNRPDSTPLSEGAIKRLQSDTRERALTEWELIRDYLNENCDTYTLWNNDSKKVFLPKFKGLKKTDY